MSYRLRLLEDVFTPRRNPQTEKTPKVSSSDQKHTFPHHLAMTHFG